MHRVRLQVTVVTHRQLLEWAKFRGKTRHNIMMRPHIYWQQGFRKWFSGLRVCPCRAQLCCGEDVDDARRLATNFWQLQIDRDFRQPQW